ncbi:ATP-binding protein [Candidatus Woesearchaeota archaeon]|nr:ATP-binding protein [Candidatus Woesearchaeota archaeon]
MEKFVERDIEKVILPWLDSREILAIRGPRQSGKTTLLMKIKDILVGRGEEVHFLSFEDDLEREKFEANPKEYITYYARDSRKHFFLLDEVQYVKNAGKLLKLVYDSFENLKIIITGSSTLDMNKVGSFLVGRVLFFPLYPFSFSEFLKARDQNAYGNYHESRLRIASPKEVGTMFLDTLNGLFKEYLIFGGYPKIVLEHDFEKKKFLLKNLFLTYIEKDIVNVYGVGYKQKILDLIRILASQDCSILNFQELCSLTGLYFKELKTILGILEDTYTIRLVKPFHKNLRTELRKNPKVYFQDIGLRNAITGRFDFSEDDFGKLLENGVLSLWREERVNFWRTSSKAEVDFIVGETIPVEVKVFPKVSRSLRSFLAAYHPGIAIVANWDSSTSLMVEKTKVFFVPAALL